MANLERKHFVVVLQYSDNRLVNQILGVQSEQQRQYLVTIFKKLGFKIATEAPLFIKSVSNIEAKII